MRTFGEVQPLSLPVSLTPMYLGAWRYGAEFGCTGDRGWEGLVVLGCCHLELPGKAGHDVDGISAAHTNSTHAETWAEIERRMSGRGR